MTYIVIKRESKFDCVICEMLFIKELKLALNKQSDSESVQSYFHSLVFYYLTLTF